MARSVEFDEELAISKAMDVFWKKGYSGTSMRDLTEAMGINSSSLYNTIGDKHQLFLRSIRHYTESKMQGARQEFHGIRSPLKAIEKYINSSARALINEPNSCLAIKTTFEVATGDPEVQKIIKADNEFTHDFLFALVKKAIEAQEIRISQDAEMLTDYIINHFTGWHESFIIHQDKTRIRKMAAFVIKVISQ